MIFRGHRLGEALPLCRDFLAAAPARQEPDGAVLVCVQQNAQDEPSRGARHVDDPDRAQKVRELRRDVRQNVGRLPQEPLVEGDVGVVGEKREISDGGFDEILKEVRAEGDVRHVVSPLPCDLDPPVCESADQVAPFE